MVGLRRIEQKAITVTAAYDYLLFFNGLIHQRSNIGKSIWKYQVYMKIQEYMKIPSS